VYPAMSKFVIFGLAEEKYGVSIEQVREIMPCTDVTPVPGTPRFFEGFLNLRGELISLINLRLFVGMEDISQRDEASILILSSREGMVQGILVDEVTSITEISWDDLQTIEEGKDGKGFPKELLKGIVDTDFGLVVILDVERILSDKNQENISNSITG